MYSFHVSSGVCWKLEAGDPAAATVVEGFADVLNLTNASVSGGSLDDSRKVRVFSTPPESPSEGISCVLPRPKTPEETPFVYYIAISHALARGLLRDGGFLLHGALAEYRPEGSAGKGVILSAHGGAGKSTASRRLPLPWHSLSDDAVLVIPAENGGYRAHPWPTWSTFFYKDRAGNAWDVQVSVPLCVCIFLKQADRDALEPLGAGKAASLLNESARQINALDVRLPLEELRPLRLMRFDAVCNLAKAVPAHLLHISLEGEFWREVELLLR